MLQRIADFCATQSAASITICGSGLGVVWGLVFDDKIAPLVWWLIAFVVLDFFTGWAAAVKTNSFTSRRLGEEIFRKFLIFVICAAAHGIDVFFHPVIGVSIFQSMVLCMYGLGEFASILENLEKAGYGASIPPILRRLIGALNHRLEETVERVVGEEGEIGEGKK